MRITREFMKLPWDRRRLVLLGDLVDLMRDLDGGKIPYVHTDIHHIYVHFHRGTKELGDLGFATALSALWDDVWRWPDGGVEKRGQGRGELDLQEADRLELRTH
jgi:hypothetical protein